ncbi:gamma-glutamyltransferase family protein [Pleurocapsa sp. PCC 7319]|uniref:gamma-glutamyltransferase family protein n=1 Tax=Pleurocapsa sp. PCC 7319 TaxID=118161 RepID=UPI00034834CF|nr:gamma-glutamyltransferase [Pleurocapsa sp. PCC 7319]
MPTVAFTAPHYQASEVGLAILKEGGSAVDAMVAAAATIAVVYPHMNSLGGDSFWIIHYPGKKTVAIDASGYAATKANIDWYHQQGLQSIPTRGARAALTVAGTIGGWLKARQVDAKFSDNLPLTRLLNPATELAHKGISVSKSLQLASEKTITDLKDISSFASVYLPQGKSLQAGEILTNRPLAQLLSTLAAKGLDDFYRGETAQAIAESLSQAGSPIQLSDLHNFHAEVVEPLNVKISQGQLFNTSAPTQGIASLIILALYNRVYQSDWNELERIHHLLECTKQAFKIRDRFVTDPSRLAEDWSKLLTNKYLDQLADNIDPGQALPRPYPSQLGDTVWMGALDRDGAIVSFIQSIYWEFGSGLVISELGLLWNNRGLSFSLDPNHHNSLAPKLKPFHTLNPAFALLNDGRRFVYGTMSGDGQPQTQAALFTRHIYDGLPLAQAIAQDRWLLGRTWGDISHNLKLEQNLADKVGAALSALGHDVATVSSNNEMMGHAGGIIIAPDGSLETATDPRSDGAALTVEIP